MSPGGRSGSNELSESAEAIGADFVARKPVDASELVEVAARLAGR